MSGFKNYTLTLLICWAVLFARPVLSQGNDTPKINFNHLQGAYLGQKPPGLIPEIFAEDVISNAGYRLHGFPAFSPDGTEIYWSVIPPQILYTRLSDGHWTLPKAPPFLKGKFMAPFVSPDGNRLYFQAGLPDGFGSVDIWFAERDNEGWSEFKNPGQPPNSELMESQPSLARNGNLYFTGVLEGAAFNRGIYVSKFIDGHYNVPELLPDNINTAAIDYTPFIASDESYLLFSSSRPGHEEKDIKLYVSFHEADDTWSEPVNLSKKLKIEQSARFPSVTPDGKYLIYLSGDGNLYWVSSEIIERSKPDSKTSFEKCELNKKNRGCTP